MEVENARSPHWSFWFIAVFMFIWNALGCLNFLVQIMKPEMSGLYREVEQTIIVGRPLWATAAFGFAVFGGALGCVALLLKRKASIPLFAISLLGVVGAGAHSLGVEVDFGLGELIGIVALPVAIAVFLLWYARYSQKKGWIGE